MNKHSKYIDAVNDVQSKMCSHDYEKHRVFTVMRDIVDAVELDLSAMKADRDHLHAELEQERERVKELQEVSTMILAKLDHETLPVTSLDADKLRKALSADEGEKS